MNSKDNNKETIIKELEAQNKKQREQVYKSEEENSFDKNLPDNYIKVTQEKLLAQKEYETMNNKQKNLANKLEMEQTEKKQIEDSVKSKDNQITSLKQKLEKLRQKSAENRNSADQDITCKENNNHEIKNENIKNEKTQTTNKSKMNTKSQQKISSNVLKKQNSSIKTNTSIPINVNQKNDINSSMISGTSSSNNLINLTKELQNLNSTIQTSQTVPKKFERDKNKLYDEQNRLNSDQQLLVQDYTKTRFELETYKSDYQTQSFTLSRTQTQLGYSQEENQILRNQNKELSHKNNEIIVRLKDQDEIESQLAISRQENKKLHEKIQSLLIEEKNSVEEIKERIDVQFLEGKIYTLNQMLDEKISVKNQVESKLEKTLVINEKLRTKIEEQKQKEDEVIQKLNEEEHQRQEKIYKASQKKLMDTTIGKPLFEQYTDEDNNQDPTDLTSCLKHIYKLQIQKRNLATEFERYQTVYQPAMLNKNSTQDNKSLGLGISKDSNMEAIMQQHLDKYKITVENQAKKIDTLNKIVEDYQMMIEKSYNQKNNVGINNQNSDFESQRILQGIRDDSALKETNSLEFFLGNATIQLIQIIQILQLKSPNIEFDKKNIKFFVTVDFQTNEAMTSNLVKNQQCNFNSQMQFKFKVDEEVINQFQNDSIKIEFYCIINEEATKLGNCNYKLKELLSDEFSKNQMKDKLSISIDNDLLSIVNKENLEIKRIADINITLKLTKSMKNFIAAINQSTQIAKDINTSQGRKKFTVTILQGQDIINPATGDAEPELCAFFKFQNQTERYTKVLTGANPYWNDKQEQTLLMTFPMEDQIQRQNLKVNVMDTAAGEGKELIGTGEIPLQWLQDRMLNHEGLLEPVRKWVEVRNGLQPTDQLGKIFLEIDLQDIQED